MAVLPATDTVYLEERAIEHELAVEGGMTCVMFPSYVLPPGYQEEKADLLLRLQAGYPDLPPDMWWFSPSISRSDNTGIPATQVVENHLGRQWQRWSRHLQLAQWRSGVDGLESYLTVISEDLRLHAAPTKPESTV